MTEEKKLPLKKRVLSLFRREPGYAQRCMFPPTTNLTLREFNEERGRQIDWARYFDPIRGQFKILCDRCGTPMLPQDSLRVTEIGLARQMVCVKESCRWVSDKLI